MIFKKENQTIILKGLGYSFYGFLLFLILIYIYFPYDLLKDRIVDRLNNTLNKGVYIQKINPLLPLGVDFRDIRIISESRDSKIIIFSADKLKVRLQLTSLFSKTRQIKYFTSAYGGEIYGRIGVQRDNSRNKIWINADFNDLILEKHHAIAEGLFNASVSGRVEGDIEITNYSPGRKGAMKGKIDINIGSGSIDNLKIMAIPIPTIHYDRITGGVKFVRDNLRIKGLKLEGNDINIEVRGNILFRRDFSKSPIDVNIRFKLSPSFESEMGILKNLIKKGGIGGFSSIKIAGTIEKPKIEF